MLPKNIQTVHYFPDRWILFVHKFHECSSNLWSETEKLLNEQKFFMKKLKLTKWLFSRKIFCIFYSRDLIWEKFQVHKKSRVLFHSAKSISDLFRASKNFSNFFAKNFWNFWNLRPYRKIFSSMESEFLSLSKWGTALGCLNASTPATSSCYMTGGWGIWTPPAKNFTTEKLFFSQWNQVFFKFHQST